MFVAKDRHLAFCHKQFTIKGFFHMGTLLIFNSILIAAIVGGLWVVKKYVKGERAQNILLITAAAVTIIFHYSSFIFKLISGSGAIGYLTQNPNLLLPIYPCNVVMWSALIFALLKNKRSRLGIILGDYIFWFGIISTLVGMFANVDFINNPTLANYENVKSIGAHATLLFNVILIPMFGYVKTDVKRNMRSIIISIVAMALIGGYCNILLAAIGSRELAYDKNSMFMIHSPFEGVKFLTYPVIALVAIPIYLGLFYVCDVCARKRARK